MSEKMIFELSSHKLNMAEAGHMAIKKKKRVLGNYQVQTPSSRKELIVF